MGVSVKYVLDQRRSLADGSFPVKLILTIDRSHRKYSILDERGNRISLLEESFNKIQKGNRLSDSDKNIRGILNASVEMADNLISNILSRNPPLTFAKFSDLYKNKVKPTATVKDVFGQIIKKLEAQGRLGTASSYRTAMNALAKFRMIENLGFDSITPDFLRAFEKFLRDNLELSTNSVGVYLRSIKVVINQAIADCLVDSSQYPFGKGKYVIPREATRKRALSKEDMRKLFDYSPISGSPQFFAKQYFLFSFFCNGMNFADLVELKKSNIDGDWIKYYRKKTTNTAQEKKLIQIYIDDNIRDIIDSLGASEGRFLFSIIKENSPAEKQRADRQQFIKTTNHWLKKIAQELDLSEKNISTYYARHTWATLQKRSGRSTEIISDSLGHNSIKTTQIYLDSFDEDALRTLNAGLI